MNLENATQKKGNKSVNIQPKSKFSQDILEQHGFMKGSDQKCIVCRLSRDQHVIAQLSYGQQRMQNSKLNQRFERAESISTNAILIEKQHDLELQQVKIGKKILRGEEFLKEAIISDQITCPICYEDFNIEQISNLKCGHQFCRNCLVQNIDFLLNNGAQVNKIVCPDSTCKRKLLRKEIKQLLNEEQFKKYQRFVSDKQVIQSKFKRFCPYPECGAVIDISKFNGKWVKCRECERSFCKKCSGLLKGHAGKTCKQYWALLIGKQNYISQCPKCQQLIEKIAGCNHMTCTVCRYEWCWVCGLNYASRWHQGAGNGFVCSIIGGTYFRRNKYCAIISLILIGLFLPLFTFGISYVFIAALQVFLIQTVSEKDCMYRCLKQIRPVKERNTSYNILKRVFTIILAIIIGTMLVIIFTALIIALGTLMFAIMLIPSYFIYFGILYRFCKVWGKKIEFKEDVERNIKGQRQIQEV